MRFHAGLAGTTALVLAALLSPLSARQAAPKPPAAPPVQDVSPEPESTLEAPSAERKRAAEGETFPALKLEALHPGGTKLVPLDLAEEIGRRPIVFVYFLMEYQISEDTLQEVREFVKSEVKGKVALYPVVRVAKSRPITELVERVKLLGIEEPVIVDQEGRLQKALAAGVVPNITLVDQKGVFCYTNASSLKQPIMPEIDVRESIRMAARGEDPPVVFGLQRYYPASDFIGEKFKDLTLPDYKTGDDLKLSDHVKPGRLTALFYWGPRCPYSKLVMPAVAAASRTYHEKFLDVISIVKMKSGESRDEVEKYASAAGIEFPILEDRGHRFTNGYRVTSTPTLILIRPDGVVDSVYTSSRQNFYAILQAKIRYLIVRPAAPAAAPQRPRAKSS